MQSRLTCTFLIVAILACALAAPAQSPNVTVYFDPVKSPVGPATSARIGEVIEAYVVVENFNGLVGGTAFRLGDLGSLQLLGYDFPPGLEIGGLFTGVEVGFTSPIAQFDAPAVLCALTLLTTQLTVTEIWPLPHPDYGAVLVGEADGPTHEADVLPGTVFVVVRPEIGLFFDAAGTALEASFIGGADETRPVFLMIRDLDVPIQSAFVSLDLPPSMSVAGSTLPAGVSMLGDWTGDVTLLFDPPLEAYGTDTSLMAEITLNIGGEYLDQEPLTVGGHDGAGTAPAVYTGFPSYFPAIPLTSIVSVPIGNEERSWGSVKTLFR